MAAPADPAVLEKLRNAGVDRPMPAPVRSAIVGCGWSGGVTRTPRSALTSGLVLAHVWFGGDAQWPAPWASSTATGSLVFAAPPQTSVARPGHRWIEGCPSWVGSTMSGSA
jgi:hypothetical protein